MLRVELLSGSCAEEVAGWLRELDSMGLLAVMVVDRPGVAALVVDTDGGSADERVADVVLDGGAALAEQVERLWSQRLAPFATRLAGITSVEPEPAVLRAHDPGLVIAGQRRAGLDDGQWTYDHIGSTSVPELRAKRFIDLQLGVGPLPAEGSAMDDVLAAVGANGCSSGLIRRSRRSCTYVNWAARGGRTRWRSGSGCGPIPRVGVLMNR
jgi:hypothetical protein